MTPLKVAIILRWNPQLSRRATRSIGLFSYAVPEFKWEHFRPGKFAPLKREDFENFDVVVIEDGSNVNVSGHGPPVVGIFWDTNNTEMHYAHRLVQASQCDLVLIGQDPLKRFVACRKPVKRLTYCVNDRLFHDYGEEKTVDIGWHMKGYGNLRRVHALKQVQTWVDTYPAVFDARTVGHDGGEYAKAFNRAKISMNVGQTPANRPHRMFDAAASRTCVVTSRLPFVDEEYPLIAGEHYLEFNPARVGDALEPILEDETWKSVTEAGYSFVRKHHTWAKRAPELRALIEGTL